MKLNNIWGYGQLFGFSGLDGPNRYYNDFIATLCKEKVAIRFELRNWVKFILPIKEEISFNAIMSDFIDGNTKTGRVVVTFVDNDTLIGYSPVMPLIEGEQELVHIKTWDTDVYSIDKDYFGLVVKKQGDIYKYCLHHSFNPAEARSGVNYYIDEDVDSILKSKYSYYETMPECKRKEYEMLYYKALSINKVNVHTPEGKIGCMWTTPDRVPHRDMWLWDSVFHALAIVTYNKELAKEIIWAVLSQQRRDGFISHKMNPTDSSDVTQPQVLAWGVWEVYQKTKDKDFLQRCVPILEKYLTWDIKNRDKNGNDLLEWLTEPDYTECKCGESGLDNSPRFDYDIDMDAIDFSTFSARDALYLSYIYHELGNIEFEIKWKSYYEHMKELINSMMWDEETGAYYDRLFDGSLTKVITPSSFIPMFANISTKEQAQKMVETMQRKDMLWTELPLSTIATTHPSYSSDMWRGCVWLNHNYFIIKGLLNYGYVDLANEIKNKMLKAVDKWYKQSGCIFEFYDSQDKISPFMCDRKGKALKEPDWRKQVHSITDYNWSACFTILFIQDELY